MDFRLPILARKQFLPIHPDICSRFTQTIVQAANRFFIAAGVEEKYSKWPCEVHWYILLRSIRRASRLKEDQQNNNPTAGD
jgi:hypothetical protein